MNYLSKLARKLRLQKIQTPLGTNASRNFGQKSKKATGIRVVRALLTPHDILLLITQFLRDDG